MFLLRRTKTLSAFSLQRLFYSAEVSVENHSVRVNSGTKSAQTLHNFWLRENCTCGECFNNNTKQRKTSLLSLPLDTTPLKVGSRDGNQLSIVWSDGHSSRHDFSWILSAIGDSANSDDATIYRKSHTKKLWNGKQLEEWGGIPKVERGRVLDGDGDCEVIRNLLVYGISGISDMSADPQESKAVCEKISMLQNNVYGDYWVINPLDSSQQHHADTAYTTEALGAHTDGAYSRNTPGVQAFHILHVPPTGGGKTLLVDGFHAAKQLKETDPEAFKTLSEMPIEHHSIEKNYHLRSLEPVITLDPLTGEIEQIRYNPYDRSPITHMKPQELDTFYRSYRSLMKIIQDPSNEFWVQLDSGTLLLTYNWRVLHGRSGFEGKRTLSGCYIARDEFLSKARSLRLL